MTAIKRKQGVCLSRPEVSALGRSLHLSSLFVSLTNLRMFSHMGKCYTALLEVKKVFLVEEQRGYIVPLMA